MVEPGLSLPDLARPIDRVTRPLRVLTAAGRFVLLLAVVGLGVGMVAGWAELRLLGLLALVLLLIALGLVRLPVRVRARLELRPDRTSAGEPAAGVLHVTNLAGVPLRHPLADILVDGRAAPAATIRLPVLERGAATATRFGLAAMERGVRRVGPATTRRTDPLGLVVRRAPVAPPVELYVRPRMVAVDHLGPGHVRDLEGRPSDEISMSDLSFHALREYVQGDDLRHVHWRSSARAGQLYVRQYHDTRRSHAVLLVDDTAAAYGRPDELELALSVAASLAVRLSQDDVDLTFGCGSERVSGHPGRVLDATCRAALGSPGDGLLDAARHLTRLAADASQLVLISGRAVDPVEVRRARAEFASDVRLLVVRTDLAAEPTAVPGMVTVSDLDDLPRLLSAAARGVLGVLT